MEKKCEDCIYYIQHYAKWKKRLISVNSGHCEIKKRQSCNQVNKPCDKWKENSGQKEAEAEKSILSALNRISKQIDDFKRILS